ncbi:hypothetical protein, partial [Muribaculum intestinale]|uniref:hypothetical protein n=1 Tax=Muribaculum intestinale TaxID=1796646 RepID=UPI0025B64DF0
LGASTTLAPPKSRHSGSQGGVSPSPRMPGVARRLNTIHVISHKSLHLILHFHNIPNIWIRLRSGKWDE